MITSRRFKTNFNKKILSEFCSCTLLPSVSTHFCEKAFISHGINQNQAQELPATGDELHTRCQYRATQNREATVMKTSWPLSLAQKTYEGILGPFGILSLILRRYFNIIFKCLTTNVNCTKRQIRLLGTGAYRVLVGKPEGRRPLGRPRRRWVDNIRMDIQEVGCGYMDWIGLAQDRDSWRTLVSEVMNLRVP